MKSDESLEEVKQERDSLHKVVHEFVNEVQSLQDKIKALECSQCSCKKSCSQNKFGSVAELVDATDLKSVIRMGVRVRLPPEPLVNLFPILN